MTQFKGAPWMVEIIEPDYLDGIKSGVTVYGNERRPVAYAFDEQEGRVMSAAPDLLEALTALKIAIEYTAPPTDFGTPGDPNPCFECRIPVAFLDEARAAITKALGHDQ